jgi:hypothetical protein
VDYDGMQGDRPILFTNPYTRSRPALGVPDTWTALDTEAQMNPPPAGVSPLLARMMPVPMGSTAMLLLPVVQKSETYVPPTGVQWAYVWRAVFRLRAVADYQRRKRARVPWSIPVSRMGTSDTRVGHPPNRATVPVAGDRTVRPTLMEAVIYNRSLPVPAEEAPYFGSLLSDGVKIPYNTLATTYSPYYPGWQLDADPTAIHTLDYEQGERDPGAFAGGSGFRTGPFHLPKFIKCVGNEMAIECYKVQTNPSTGALEGFRRWDFGLAGNVPQPNSEDFDFSLLFGIGALGIAPANVPPVDTGVRVVTGYIPA